MRRWQVKQQPDKNWGAPGPDLLRTRPNARRRIKDDMAEHNGGWFVRTQPAGGDWRAWSGPYERSEVLEAFDDWEPADKTRAQWGRKQGDGSGYDAKGAVQCRVVNITAHNGCTDHTDKVIALCETHNPGAAFGGAFVCKQVSGSSSWSEYAWGAAFDHSAYEDNDADTDWALRMARENQADDIQLPVWQIIGSKGGKAGEASNDDWVGPFNWDAGGVSDSHEWHVHLSAGKQRHSGTPPCASKAGGLEVPDHDHEGTDDEGGE
jgi:hypothetical protein